MIDKVTIRLSGKKLFAKTGADFRAYLHLVSNSDTDLFRVGGGNVRNSLFVKDNWLFSGEIHFRPRAWRGETLEVYVSAELHLNLSRFLAHFPEGGATNFRLPERGLKDQDGRSVDLRSSSLDGNDNYLSGATYVAAMSAPFIEQALRNYLRAVQALVERELGLPLEDNANWEFVRDRLSDDSLDWDVASHQEFQTCVVKTTEIYWERWTLDALGAVRQMEKVIAPTSRHVARILYPIDTSEQVRVRPENRLGNSLCFTVETGRNGAKLKVYAKQHRRVRLEIEYKGSLAQHLSVRVSSLADLEWSEFVFDLLQTARENAAGRIASFFDILDEERDVEPISMASMFEVFRQLSHACEDDQELASELMLVLLHNRGVTHPVRRRKRSEQSNERERQIDRAIDVLRRSGILQASRTQSRGGRERRYVLFPKYRAAIQAIVDLAD